MMVDLQGAFGDGAVEAVPWLKFAKTSMSFKRRSHQLSQTRQENKDQGHWFIEENWERVSR